MTSTEGNGRAALITGAGQNIGRAIALRLAADGFDIAINGRSKREQCDAVAAEVEGMGRKAVVVMGDIGTPDLAKRVADEALAALGSIDVLITKPDVHFDKMVLFAPALKMHRRNHLIRLFSPFPKLVIPSFSPPAYLANKGTPMAAYNTLFETLNHFEKNIQPKINIPTLIFIDPGDELISFSNLEAMVADRPFHQWQIHRVEKTATGKAAKIHHLIIDQESTGGDVWQSMMDRTVRHLLD